MLFIHTRRILRERPFIGYPGNCHGRHAREDGPKGRFLVTVTDGEFDIQFRAVDTLR